MVKIKRLSIFISIITLLFSGCTTITPVPTSTLRTSTPACIQPGTPREPGSIVTTAPETAHSKYTDQKCPPPSKTVDIAPQYYGRAAGSSPVWAIINRPELVLSMDQIRE